jgi:polysaccharide export outer membrane protein
MPTKVFFLSLLLTAGSIASAQFGQDTNGSTGQSSDQCLTNPTSAACAAQSQSQDQSSSNNSQNTQRGNDTLLNTDLSGSSTGQQSNTQNGIGDIDGQNLSGQTGQNVNSGRDQNLQDLRGMTPPTVLPPEQEPIENDFQNFVQISIGKRLPIFGYSLFKNAPTTFAQANRIPVTGNYIVGPGDELIISVWGPITLNARVVVNREGNIILPRVGPVNVAGVPYEQLHDKLAEAIGHYYKNFQLSASLGRLRSIQIYVTGFARRPGNYTVSSLSTLVNALFTSGGPSAQGSMRGIQLKRGGKVISQFDLYDFLLRGDSSKDIALQPEDVIFIPAVGPLVAITGAVRVPAIYELGKETTLTEEISDAGGLSTVADGSQVIIERIKDRASRTVTQVPLSGETLAMPLHDGDVIRVIPLSPKIENAVVLRGNVAVPGRYPYHDGMRIRDLIPNREFLLTPDFWKAQIAVRERSPYSRTTTASTSTSKGSSNADTAADNKLTNPSSGPRSTVPISEDHISETTIAEDKNVIKLGAPEINWDYAVVQRVNPVDLTTHLVPFNLGKALAGDDSQNIELKPGDILTIFSQRDIAVPRDERTRFVTVEGEIRAPGVYRIEPGDTLRSVLKRAGNITQNAYLYGTLVTRESARRQQQSMVEETGQAMSEEVQQRASSDTAGHPEDAAAITLRSTAQQQMANNLKNVRASGRLVLEVNPSDNSVDQLPDIPLEDGDRINIPQRIEMVSVIGAVYRQSSYVYLSGKSVRHYLRLAGSATQTADLKHALLVRADGSVVDRKSVSGLWKGGFYDVRVLPGDTLVIPTKLATGAFQRNLRDWTQIASQLAIAGASLAVISGL